MEQKNLKNKKVVSIILLFAAFCLIFTFFYFVQYNREFINSEDNKRGETNNRDIVIENLGENRVRISNIKENFSLEVSKNWQVQRSTDEKLKLKIYKEGNLSNPESMDFTDGSIIWIYSYDNNEKNNLIDWLGKQNMDKTGYSSIKFQNYEALVKKEKAQGELDSNFNYLSMEDSLVINYLVSINGKVYKMNCTSLGESYQMHADECQNVLLNIKFN